MDVRILPGRAEGVVAAPPSKSCAHRLLICAALAGGGAVRGIPRGEDVQATLDCLAALGAQFDRIGDDVIFRGSIRRGGAAAVCPCRESASTLRFLLPLSLLCGGAGFTGTPRLLQRGAEIYVSLFPTVGAKLELCPDRICAGGTLRPGRYEIAGGFSSQYVSGLLFALPLLGGESTLTVLPPVESRPYVELTLDALRRAGVTVTEGPENVFHIPGDQAYRPFDASVEGDWSAAAALLAFNAAGGRVVVTGLDEKSLQGDRVCRELLARLTLPGAEIDLAQCPDLGPALFAAAAASGCGGRFTGTRRLRMKESDRAEAMARELSAFGADTRVGENEVCISPGPLHEPDRPLDGWGDHRVVMALSVLCAVTGGVIRGAEAVDKSVPDWFDRLRRLGLGVELTEP